MNPKIKDKFPNFGDRGREVGARWRALSQAQKDKYKTK